MSLFYYIFALRPLLCDFILTYYINVTNSWHGKHNSSLCALSSGFLQKDTCLLKSRGVLMMNQVLRLALLCHFILVLLQYLCTASHQNIKFNSQNNWVSGSYKHLFWYRVQPLPMFVTFQPDYTRLSS